MTTTERILQRFVLLSLGIGVVACSSSNPSKDKKEPKVQTQSTSPETIVSYCFGIDEGKKCPPLEEVNKKMPSNSTDYCGNKTGEYLEIVDFVSQNPQAFTKNTIDKPPPPDDAGDTCCYKARYQPIDTVPNCVPGRPYVQEGENVLAQLIQMKGDWRHNGTSIPFGTKEERKSAGHFYLETARAEHASVASFNRFSLELISLGAPANLIRRAQEAALDEVRHAQQAFSISNTLLSKEFQPSAMSIDVQLAKNHLALAKAVLEEAAIQETIAVLLAVEQLRVVQSPVIKAYLQEVVEDESRHAELAFDTLRWCLEMGGEEVRTLIHDRIQESIHFSTKMYPKEAIIALGIPSQDTLKRMVQRGIREVIIPSLRSLIATKVAS